MNRRQFLIGASGVAGIGSISAVAFNSATVARDVQVQVSADDSADAMLQLDPGPAGGTRVGSDGQLVVTGESDNGSLVTPDGNFVFGDPNNPSSTYAFSLVNNLDSSREFSITTATEDSDTSIELEFFDGSGSKIGDSFTGYTVEGSSTTPVMAVQATVPQDTSIVITVNEDTDGDGTAENTAQRDIADGSTEYDLMELEWADGNEVWLSVEFSSQESATEEPTLDSVTITTDSSTNDADTGSAFQLGAGSIAYTVLTVTTSPDTSNIVGSVTFEST